MPYRGLLNCILFKTSSSQKMSHHCGLVFENILPKDEGIWKCKMDLKDVFSNTHRFKKVIDLKVRSRRRRRNKPKRRGVRFGSDDGSGEGSGDEDYHDKSNKLRTRRRKQRKRQGGYSGGYHGGLGGFGGFDGSGSGDGSGLEPDYDDIRPRGIRVIIIKEDNWTCSR